MRVPAARARSSTPPPATLSAFFTSVQQSRLCQPGKLVRQTSTCLRSTPPKQRYDRRLPSDPNETSPTPPLPPPPGKTSVITHLVVAVETHANHTTLLALIERAVGPVTSEENKQHTHARQKEKRASKTDTERESIVKKKRGGGTTRRRQANSTECIREAHTMDASQTSSTHTQSAKHTYVTTGVCTDFLHTLQLTYGRTRRASVDETVTDHFSISVLYTKTSTGTACKVYRGGTG